MRANIMTCCIQSSILKAVNIDSKLILWLLCLEAADSYRFGFVSKHVLQLFSLVAVEVVRSGLQGRE